MTQANVRTVMKSLERFVREVDAHITLRKLQDHVVPKLLSWGFLRGGMFVYVMTRDVGKDKLESDEAGESRDLNRRRILASASAALAEVHKRGILHGDIDVNKVVTKQDKAGRWTAMLVGFAQSSRVEVLSQEWSLGTAKEMAELGKIIDFLMQDSTFRERRHQAQARTSGLSSTSGPDLR